MASYLQGDVTALEETPSISGLAGFPATARRYPVADRMCSPLGGQPPCNWSGKPSSSCGKREVWLLGILPREWIKRLSKLLLRRCILCFSSGIGGAQCALHAIPRTSSTNGHWPLPLPRAPVLPWPLFSFPSAVFL